MWTEAGTTDRFKQPLPILLQSKEFTMIISDIIIVFNTLHLKMFVKLKG